jgi:hypothetical protein
MTAEHLEILVEEPSMEAFLIALLPKMLDEKTTYSIHVHQGKSDLLGKLGDRLRGYARWLTGTMRLVVLVDQDDDNCHQLKQRLERAAAASGLQTRTTSAASSWQVVNRIAVEELEAWYFGEWSAVRKAYPKVSNAIRRQAAFRASDAIAGGTWEAMARVLKTAGYFTGGFRKMEIAHAIGRHFDPIASTSPSFNAFRSAILEAVQPAVLEANADSTAGGAGISA